MAAYSIFDIPGYREIAETFKTCHPNARRLALIQIRQNCGHFLTEKEMSLALNRIQVQESKISEVVAKLLQAAHGLIGQLISYITGKSLKELNQGVEKDLPKLREAAARVRAEQGLPEERLSPGESEEIFRRAQENIPPPPEELIQKYAGMTEAVTDDGVLHFSVFFQKWTMMYLTYLVVRFLAGMSGLFTGGLGFLGFTVIHLPYLVLLLDDWFYQVNKAKYVAV